MKQEAAGKWRSFVTSIAEQRVSCLWYANYLLRNNS